ncbi:MAG: adenylate/guanylate cyclase domain-containing protein [Armatimonadota bacterium]|nr:adenylate/guanylate cyclase domain-containing protein [Armatimonadota bacterium]
MKRVLPRYVRRRAIGLLVPLCLGLLAAYLHTLPLFDTLERTTWDVRFVRRGVRATTGGVALVLIDDETAEYEPWAFEPQVMWGPHFAAAVRNLHAWGARVIGVDYLQRVSTQRLAESFGKSDLTFDQEFAQALFEAQTTGKPVVLVSILKQGRWVLPIDQLYYANGEHEGVAAANFVGGQTTDAGVVRAFRPWWEGPIPIPALAVRLLERYTGEKARVEGRWLRVGSLQAPLHRDGTLLINYVGPPRSLPRFHFHDIAEGRKPAFDFQGKVVLIGESYAGTSDLHFTPFSRGAPADQQDMTGVEVWGNAVATLLDQRFLRATEVPTAQILLVVLALVAGAVYLGTSLVVGAAACAAGCAGWWFAAQWLFGARDFLLPMYLPLALLPTTYFCVTAYRFFTEEREKRQIKRMWGRYVNPTVVEHLLENPDLQGLGGKRVSITVLFSDIRGFTAMSERLEAPEVVRILNAYLSRMTRIVFQNGGLVDKYVGDAVMAVWGAPVPCAEGPRRAVTTALQMLEALEELNKEWEAEGLGRMDIGVGINTGEAVSGNIGSPEKMDFTVIGDTVNVASRLEGLTKTCGARIVVGQKTWEALGAGFLTRPLPPAAVKGKDELLAVYAVEGWAHAAEA